VAELLFPALGLEGRRSGLRASIANEFTVGEHGRTRLAAAS
jgi:alkanesulfonate monooxygenase